MRPNPRRENQKPRSFDCPHCGAYARQYSGITYWFDGNKPDNPNSSGEVVTNISHMENVSHIKLYKCESCEKFSVWYRDNLVFPKEVQAPEPVDEMPEVVERDFQEARKIVEESPRAAAALLRLVIERLVDQLNADGDTLHQQIGNLVEEGRISGRIQRALDSVRVIGNESVHPGVMDMDDDRETATTLFKLINAIVDETIGRDQMINDIYETLPENKRQGIKNRDS